MNKNTFYIDKTILKQVRNLLDIVINNYDRIIFPDKEYNFVAHAGGGYNGKSYTNSINAVENSISKGLLPIIKPDNRLFISYLITILL